MTARQRLRRNLRHALPALHALYALLLALAAGLAQAAISLPPSPAQAIEAARGTLGGANLSDQQRQAAQTHLDAAAALDKETGPLATQLAQLHQKAQAPAATATTPPTPEEAQNQLAQWAARLPAHIDGQALEHLLAEERRANAALQARIDSASTGLTELISRPGQMPGQLAALRQRAHDSAGEPPAEADEPDALWNARRLRRAAEHRRALAELALREAEQTTADTRQQQLETQLLALRREQALRAPRIAWLTRRIAADSQQKLQAQADTQAALAAGIDPADTELTELAQTNATLARQLLDGTRALAGERGTLADSERQREQAAATLRDTQARLRLGGGSVAIGQWLWQQRLAMPSLLALRAQRKDVQQRLAALRLDLYHHTEARYALTRGTDTAPPTAAASDAEARAAQAPSPARLAAWQATRAALLDQTQPLLRRRIEVLEQTDGALQALQAHSDELGNLMARQLLWVPSHAPIGSQWLAEWRAQARRAAARPATLGAATRALADDLSADWPPYLLLGAAFTGLLALRLGAPRRLRAIGQRMRDLTHDRFGLTLQALLWTLLLALPAAVAVWGTGMALQDVGARAGARASWVEALGHALSQTGELMLFTGLWSALTVPGGLAAAHLGWPPERIRMLRRLWPVATAILLPTAFLAVLALHLNDDTAVGTLGRLAIMLMALGLAVLAWRLLRRPPSPATATARPAWRRLMRVLLPSAFAGVALLAATGYVFTGLMVLDALLDSFTVVLAIAVLDGLLRRWLLLSERRLTLRRLREQRGAEGHGVVDPETGIPLPEAEREMSLVSISEQTRRLLRLLRTLLLALGLLWVWSDVSTALLRLDEVVLWHSTTTGADGKPAPMPVSLMSALFGLLMLLLTFSMVRNLPGLLALALASSRRISASTRYTAATLARYAITIAGVLLAFSLLGLRWSQLQWMAAALTVGLGFGLQEIFANFVSGLILLVERPFRVGDTITIGELTGTVTRIHTRATTVLDYDNKEIVIPNKTFITGQVTNWTLSDSVTRLTLNVGVAYGSAPEQVRALLLRAAHDHPGVLAEPAPNAWFMTLGASTLDFELRVYVAALGERLKVRHDLNRRITELLGEAGIEIAFPQLDVHLRDAAASPPHASAPPEPGGC